MEERSTLALPKERTQEYEAVIRKNLAALMRSKQMSQTQLRDELEKRGLNVLQGNVSQYLSGRKSIPLSVIVQLCDIFQVSLAELVSEEFCDAKRPVTQMPQIYSDDLMNLIPSLGDAFITDPAAPEFHGYLQTYYFYIKRTQAFESGMLTGTLTLCSCGGICEAHMDLDTGKAADGKPLHKHYSGPVIIAKKIDAVYILLTSPIEGDLSVISFQRFHLPHQPLDCRVAAVLTIESSEHYSPTMHRMLLSRTPIQPEHLPLAMPHLQFNNSTVTIPKKDLDRLLRNAPEYAQLLNALTMTIPPSESYYWSEDYVMGIAKHFLPKEQIPLFLARIREITDHCSFNKASRRSNDLLRNLLLSLGYFRDHDM